MPDQILREATNRGGHLNSKRPRHPDGVDMFLGTCVDLASEEMPVTFRDWDLTMSFGDVRRQCKRADAPCAFSRIALFKSAATGALS